jgi:hypothetical protein
MKQGTFARTAILLIALQTGLAMLVPMRAEAMSTEMRGLFRIGAYGLVGGTALGVAAYPMTGDLRTIFVGTSIGLYLGLAIGTIYALQPDDSPPPPWQSRHGGRPGAGLASSGASDSDGARFALTAREAAAFPKALLEVQAPVLRF